MLKSSRALYLLSFFFLSFIITGCGFQLKQEQDVPKEFSRIQFYSNDKYGMLTRNVRQILAANHVTIVNEQPNYTQQEIQSYPALYLLGSRSSTSVTSVYPNGASAESQMVFTAQAKMVVNGETYPLTAKIFRTFFDNPATPLAKSTEEDLIQSEMYTQAARELIQQLKTVATTVNQ